MIVVIIGIALLKIAFVPLVCDEFARKLNPDVQSGRGGIALKGLAIETTCDKIVLENEVISPLGNGPGHDLGLGTLTASGKNDNRENGKQNIPFHYFKSLVAHQSMSL